MMAHWFPPCQAWPSAAARISGFAKWLPAAGWAPVILVPKLGDACGCAACVGGFPRTVPAGVELVEVSLSTRALWRIWRRVDARGRGGGGRGQGAGTGRTTTTLKSLFEVRTNWPSAVEAVAHEVIRTHEIGGIWATAGPYVTLQAAARIHAKTGLPWVADLRDPISMPAGGTRLQNALQRGIRLRLRPGLRTAAAVVAATPQSAVADEAWLGRKCTPITSGFDPEDWKDVTPRRLGDALSLVYAGALYGAYYTPDPVIEAMARVRDRAGPVLFLHYFGRDGERLHDTAARYGVSELVHDHGTIPPPELRGVLKGADIQILLEGGSTHPAVPGKLYEYIGAGRPILATPGRHPVVRAAVRAAGSGVCAGGVGEIEDQLIRWVGEFHRTGRVAARGDAEGRTRFSMKNKAAELGAILDEVTGR